MDVSGIYCLQISCSYKACHNCHTLVVYYQTSRFVLTAVGSTLYYLVRFISMTFPINTLKTVNLTIVIKIHIITFIPFFALI